MNTERKTNNPGSLVEKIATGKANALEIDHDDLLIGISFLLVPYYGTSKLHNTDTSYSKSLKKILSRYFKHRIQ